MTRPQRRVLTDWHAVSDAVYAAAEGVSHWTQPGAGDLADVLVHLADEMSDENAVEVEWPDRLNSKRTVVADSGMGQESNAWTAAWAYARTVLEIPAAPGSEPT